MIRYFLIFLIGFLASAFIFYGFLMPEVSTPFGTGLVTAEVNAPSDWIEETDIFVFDDRLVIFMDNLSLSSYAKTKSMGKTLDMGANGIRTKARNADQIKVGDIVSFKSGELIIVHRVVEKGIDEDGVYFITKGDANNARDDKIRFEDIEYVTIGILY